MNASSYRLVVTSGPTREWIDPVRFISNPSSGRTGWGIARRGLKYFKEVVFISGPAHHKYISVQGAKNILVDTTEEMKAAVHKSIKSKTLLIMAAAPADFTPDRTSDSKIKKTAAKQLNVKLVPTTDILKSLKDHGARDFYRVGFAAETDHVSENALDKLERKGLDFICANQVFKESQGFGEHANTLHLLGHDGELRQFGPGDKLKIADDLLKYLIRVLP